MAPAELHSSNQPSPRRVAKLGALAALGIVTSGVLLVGTGGPARASTNQFNVAAFGANGNGTADNTAAFTAAIAAAERAGGGTVVVPAGTYAFTTQMGGAVPTSIHLNGPDRVDLVGAGANQTALVEHVFDQNLLVTRQDGTQIEGLTIDSRTYGGGIALTDGASDTLVANDTILGPHKNAVIGQGFTPFALYFQGPPGARPSNPSYDVGNTVRNVHIVDGVDNDGFSFSYQKDATITDVTHFGSRLALYVDDDVTVTNYDYTPNPECMAAEDGYWITSPSEGITINGFTTAGTGGVIGGSANTLYSSDITIKGEKFTNPSAGRIQVGNVHGLTIEGADFGSGNNLMINPPDSATGITVRDSTIPNVQLSGHNGQVNGGVDLTMTNDTFGAYQRNGKPFPTFNEARALGPSTISVSGGTWSNTAGGFERGAQPVDASRVNGYQS